MQFYSHKLLINENLQKFHWNATTLWNQHFHQKYYNICVYKMIEYTKPTIIRPTSMDARHWKYVLLFIYINEWHFSGKENIQIVYFFMRNSRDVHSQSFLLQISLFFHFNFWEKHFLIHFFVCEYFHDCGARDRMMKYFTCILFFLSFHDKNKKKK